MVDSVAPPEDVEAAYAWMLSQLHTLSLTESRYLSSFDGSNVGSAARSAGVGPSAIRERRRRNRVFALAEKFVVDGRRGLSSAFARSKLEKVASAAVDRLVEVALGTPTSARAETARLQALIALLDRAGVVAPLRPTAVTVNVGGDNRRLDVLAIDLWNARKARERLALESPAALDAGVDASPAAQVVEVGGDREPRPFPSEPSPYSPTPNSAAGPRGSTPGAGSGTPTGRRPPSRSRRGTSAPRGACGNVRVGCPAARPECRHVSAA